MKDFPKFPSASILHPSEDGTAITVEMELAADAQSAKVRVMSIPPEELKAAVKYVAKETSTRDPFVLALMRCAGLTNCEADWNRLFERRFPSNASVGVVALDQHDKIVGAGLGRTISGTANGPCDKLSNQLCLCYDSCVFGQPPSGPAVNVGGLPSCVVSGVVPDVAQQPTSFSSTAMFICDKATCEEATAPEATATTDANYLTATNTEAKLSEENPPSLEVGMTAVDPRYCSRRVGEAICQLLVDLAEKKGFSKIRCVTTNVYCAKAFKHCGFTNVATCPYRVELPVGEKVQEIETAYPHRFLHILEKNFRQC